MTKVPSKTRLPVWLVRSGLVPRSKSRNFWVHGNDPKTFESLWPTLSALNKKYPRLEILLTASDPSVLQWLSETFPEANVFPPPWAIDLSIRRYLINLKVRGVILMSPLEPLGRPLMSAADSRGAPVILMTLPAGELGADDPSVIPQASVMRHVKQAFVGSQALRQSVMERGLPAERVRTLSSGPETWTAPILDALGLLLAEDHKVARMRNPDNRRWLERLLAAMMETPFWRQLLSFKVRRIDTIEALRQELGNPRTILCLGNGPSSEGPEVESQAYDALFRVKHVWLPRGILTNPDVVFTGTKASVSTLRGPIFCLQKTRSEPRLLATRFLLPWTGRIRYATGERLGLFLYGPDWSDIRPTNGAAMIAAAAALQPARLVISGIDLYSHPDGAYPGDTATPNAYSPGHGLETEVQLFVTALSQYRGELVILSDALAARWKAHQEQAAKPQELAPQSSG